MKTNIIEPVYDFAEDTNVVIFCFINVIMCWANLTRGGNIWKILRGPIGGAVRTGNSCTLMYICQGLCAVFVIITCESIQTHSNHYALFAQLQQTAPRADSRGVRTQHALLSQISTYTQYTSREATTVSFPHCVAWYPEIKTRGKENAANIWMLISLFNSTQCVKCERNGDL